jgi:hypothetical protein
MKKYKSPTMFVDPNAPMPPNRGGVPARSVNDLQPMQTITDPGMQSAQQADAYAKFNNTAQYMTPPTMKKEGEEKLYAGDVSQSKEGVGTIENNITKQRRNNAQELEGNKGTDKQPKNTNYTSMLPEIEIKG